MTLEINGHNLLTVACVDDVIITHPTLPTTTLPSLYGQRQTQREIAEEKQIVLLLPITE